jgi:hypothetical protein
VAGFGHYGSSHLHAPVNRLLRRKTEEGIEQERRNYNFLNFQAPQKLSSYWLTRLIKIFQPP